MTDEYGGGMPRKPDLKDPAVFWADTIIQGLYDTVEAG